MLGNGNISLVIEPPCLAMCYTWDFYWILQLSGRFIYFPVSSGMYCAIQFVVSVKES